MNSCLLILVAVTESLYTDDNQRSMEDLSDISFDDDLLDGSNLFSDPESEWGMEKNRDVMPADLPLPPASPPDSRPEVDQPAFFNL